MTKIEMILKPRNDSPVEGWIISVIRPIHKAAATLGFPIFIVGAMARIILMENVFGLARARATVDIDFAVALEDWEQFENIKQHLITNSGFEESAGEMQRLLIQLPGLQHKARVDLIPFGEIEREGGIIAWPPDLQILMNVGGYADVFSSSVAVEIEQGFTVKIVSLPGLAILKIFAWSERGRDTAKDATDLATVLRGYYMAGNENRLFDEASEALEEVGHDWELAGAWLLGRDAASIGSPRTIESVKQLIEGEHKERLLRDVSKAMLHREDAVEYSERLLEQFAKGFNAKMLSKR
jgi:predicted nucleotidyltransferase